MKISRTKLVNIFIVTIIIIIIFFERILLHKVSISGNSSPQLVTNPLFN